MSKDLINKDYINFSHNDLPKFKMIYERACKDKQESLFFKGKEFIVPYAKYVIEYLESKFKPTKP
jgi:hypothetical protein